MIKLQQTLKLTMNAPVRLLNEPDGPGTDTDGTEMDGKTSATVHMIKLCVGVDAIEELSAWQARRSAERAQRGLDPRPWHVTRMWPKRADELRQGGSLYWVFKGVILARQRILRLEEHRGADGILRCAIVFDPDLVRTEAAQRRPFQGWRYLKPEDAPADLTAARAMDDTLPPTLAMALADIGVR